MPVHVLLFDAGSENEGIHSLELNGTTVVLLFEDRDDAERYAGLLEAQDFPTPTVESLDREEMELFCVESGYQARVVPSGFLPQSAEERLLIAPPEANMDVSSWQEQADRRSADGEPESPASVEPLTSSDPELENFRRRLEGLL
ncbi:DUF3110 domain-containing protein [Cyanobium sp. Morenito 9A2]|uniref:DUF3110 domain-containing protein n=1 Tax=Cyanobium sp. Morenito 9A2 TaxID=2823718 RepID=UPI0020CF3746|nr:DUF3110 domain-containing protein [Cyanobium sp. Morenito 9A2]MCP9850096.1 DUF3110 domain-containing protein [Cyanobium sp. Morenito 9A2]